MIVLHLEIIKYIFVSLDYIIVDYIIYIWFYYILNRDGV